MWSPAVINTPPALLLVDASRNLAGWESEFCDRLFNAMARRGLEPVGSTPLRVGDPSDLKQHSLTSASCVLIVGHGQEAGPSAAQEMHAYLSWLRTHLASPKLLAVCSWQDYDPTLTDEVLKSPNEFAPLAIAQQSPVTAREAGLFFLKFFTELQLHSENQMSGRMVWFAWSKAKELLNRRGLRGRFGVRA
jgi:hypothetical protein